MPCQAILICSERSRGRWRTRRKRSRRDGRRRRRGRRWGREGVGTQTGHISVADSKTIAGRYLLTASSRWTERSPIPPPRRVAWRWPPEQHKSTIPKHFRSNHGVGGIFRRKFGKCEHYTVEASGKVRSLPCDVSVRECQITRNEWTRKRRPICRTAAGTPCPIVRLSVRVGA